MKYSMTQGSIWKAILFFTLPILGGLLLQQLYSTVDGIVVGNFVSSAALGAVGTCTPVTSLLISIASGFSSGFGIIFAQFFGAKETEKMRKSYSTILVLMLMAGIVFTLIGLLLGELILDKLLGVPADTLPMATTYLRIYSIGMTFQMLYNALAAALRSMGDSGCTLIFLVISTVINIVLDLFTVIALHWGIAGAAIATVIAQAASVLAAFIYIKKRYPQLWLKKLVFDKELALLITKLGVPTAFQSSALSLGSLFLQRLINSFGSSMMEAYTAASRIESFVCMPIISFNIAISTFVGQNIGAGQMHRVKKGLWTTMLMGFIMVEAIAAVIAIFASPLIALFGCSGDALELGRSYLLFMAAILFTFLFLFVIKGALQGAGDVTSTAVITIISMVLRIAFAYIAAGYVGERAIWYSMAVDFISGSVMMLIRYLSGRWKDKAVVKAEEAA